MSTDTQTVDKAFVEETCEEPRMPGHESAMDDKPDWQPRYPGSDRLKGKVAIVTGSATGLVVQWAVNAGPARRTCRTCRCGALPETARRADCPGRMWSGWRTCA